MQNGIHRKQAAAVVPWASLEELPESVQDQLLNVRRGVPTVVVLYYGGTIGMVPDDSGVLQPTNDAQKLLEPILSKNPERELNVIWFQVYPTAIDSTNGRWFHWVTIGNAIKLLYAQADGFVICGGTDTMAHLVAALQFMFPNIGKPIICTGSQTPMSVRGSDAEENLAFALDAATSDLSGAHLAFGRDLIHGLGANKVRHDDYVAFDSPAVRKIGRYHGELTLFPNRPVRNRIVTTPRLAYLPNFREGVKVIRISPATPCESVLNDARDPFCYAVLLVTYGAGNVRDVPAFEGELTHIDAIKTLRAEGVPVVLGSSMMDGVVDSPYAPGAAAVSQEVGAISGGDTTGPTLEVKMMHSLALAWDEAGDVLDSARFRDAMVRDHIGELNVQLRK